MELQAIGGFFLFLKAGFGYRLLSFLLDHELTADWRGSDMTVRASYSLPSYDIASGKSQQTLLRQRAPESTLGGVCCTVCHSLCCQYIKTW